MAIIYLYTFMNDYVLMIQLYNRSEGVKQT